MTDDEIRRRWKSVPGGQEGSRERYALMAKMSPGLKRELIDLPHRDPMLHPHYESGQRVEVTTKYGETKRCYIGRSTGWSPAYLCIKTKRSMGGDAFSHGEVLSVKPVGARRR